MKKYADIRIILTVSFDDNGEDDLRDQAIEALSDAGIDNRTVDLAFVEIVGDVRDTPFT